ncbi:MAG: alpha/beta fold hydrolase [Dehalococcoidia bacterium]
MPHKNVNGVSLYYEEHGSGPPVLFHHGYTSSHDCWEGVVPPLSDRYRCIAMDCRGAGDSEHAAGGYTIAQMADDVIGMADALGLATFTYVGLSMGGAIGFELGVRYGSRLEKLALVAPAPAGGIRVPASQEAAMRDQWARRGEPATRERLFKERMITGGRPDPDYLRRAVDRTLSVSEGHYFGAWQSLVDLRLEDRLAGITTPTLMVAAAADGLLPSNLADFQRLGNATLHVFSRVGHGIPYEVPADLARVLADFFEHGVVTAATQQAKLQEARAAAG